MELWTEVRLQRQARHMHLVMAVYRLLMRQLRHSRAKTWALQRLTTFRQACRDVADETLRSTRQWAVTQIVDKSQNMTDVFAHEGLF